jgi:hypothetical protein
MFCFETTLRIPHFWADDLVLEPLIFRRSWIQRTEHSRDILTLRVRASQSVSSAVVTPSGEPMVQMVSKSTSETGPVTNHVRSAFNSVLGDC